MKVKLGKNYRDPITGFSGVAVSRTIYLYGCSRIGLQSQVNKDGRIPDTYYFDELQLLEAKPNRGKGGPRPDPIQIQNPR